METVTDHVALLGAYVVLMSTDGWAQHMRNISIYGYGVDIVVDSIGRCSF